MLKINLFIFLILILLSKQKCFESDIFWTKVAQNPNENIFYSPFSLELAIAMAYEGAENTTQEQIAKAFNFNTDKIIQRKQIKDLLDSIDDSQTKMRAKEQQDIDYFKQYQPDVNISEIPNSYFYMRTANSLWPNKNLFINTNYIKVIEDYYNGEVTKLDYNKTEESRQTINTWVESKTDYKIKDLIAQGSIDSETKLVIVNALHFKAAWQNKFESELTTKEAFNLANGEINKVEMMKQRGYFNFYEDEIVKIIELPFKNQQASFFVMMSISKDITLGENIDQNEFLSLQKKMKNTYIQIGITDAFNSKANFSTISDDDISITDIIQKTYIDVQESGVEAAAATAVTFATTSMPEGNTKFIANRPFIFCIQFNAQQKNLFFGTIKQFEKVNLNEQNEKQDEKIEQNNSQNQNQNNNQYHIIDKFQPETNSEMNSSSEKKNSSTNKFALRMNIIAIALGFILLFF